MLRAQVRSLRVLLVAAAATGVVQPAAVVGRTFASAGAAPAAASVSPPVRATLDRYCVTCHNDRLRTAGLSLQSIDTTHPAAHAEVWEKVVAKLRSGAMPPANLPRPDERTVATVAVWLEGALDEAARHDPNPGRPAVHRLNRTEYSNAIRDLLALDVDSRRLLPADDQGFGFDNNADMLATSPGLLDRYLLAARRIAARAVGDPTIPPTVETFPVSRLATQTDRAGDDLPFGTRGGLVVRHWFPADADYVVKVRLQGTALRGGEPLDLRLDGERIVPLPADGARPGGDPPGAAEPAQDIRFAATAGPHVISVGLVKRTVVAEGLVPSRLPVGNITFRASGVAAVELSGPFDVRGVGDTPSRRRIFICRPTGGAGDTACATRILSALARRAYRRPVVEKDVRILLDFFERGREGGFDLGIRAALERILIDPEFLFRVEREPAGADGRAYAISDLELASRLSFFLWSSIPDDELLDAAAEGRLRAPAVQAQQVRRMLADPRARALVTNFAAQWLHLRNLRAVAPDQLEFPDFDDDLREALQTETELFVESQIRENRPIGELLDANYTFLNERLARHYGIPHVYGSHFRRHVFEGGERGGLLGHGSILTVTSYATRTSPVVRGKWLLENILGAPPPPPPPDVPALADNDGGTPRTVRERMERHRANPVCASCHARMDPLGFALENFDAIGRWRDTGEDGAPIDAAGAMPDGTAFAGPRELRRVLMTRQEAFAATVAEKLLTYAIGRGIEYYDRPALRTIVDRARSDRLTWSSLVAAVVASPPFQMRKAKP